MSKTLNNLLPYIGFEDDVLLSNAKNFPSMISFFELSLYDKDCLSLDEKYIIADSLKSIFESLPDDIAIQQYLVKYEDSEAELSPCDNIKVNHLIDDHLSTINNSRSYQTKLVWVLSCNTSSFHVPGYGDLITSFFKFFSRKISLNELKKAFSEDASIEIIGAKLKAAYVNFKNVLSRFKKQITSVDDFFVCRPLDKQEISNFLSFLSTLDKRFLLGEVDAFPSGHSLDITVPEIFKCDIDYTSALQFNTAKPSYMYCGSLIRFSGKTKPDFWTFSKADLMDVDGEFIAYACFKPFTPLQRVTAFTTTKLKAEQIYNNPIRVAIESRQREKGNDIASLETKNPKLHKQLLQLDEAKNLEINYGNAIFSVFPFSSSIDRLNDTKASIEPCVIAGNGHIVWESEGIMPAYHSLMPSNFNHSARFLRINTHQFGALSLAYTQHKGQHDIKVVGSDEPLLYFQTDTNERFAFSPYAGQKSLILGIGSTRSGKTFLKNFIASMMLKWNGKVSFIDIDKGSYPVANHFNDQSSIFELPGYKYNPFSDYVPGVNDRLFIEHIVNLFDLIAEDSLTYDERCEVERWTSRLLKMSSEKHTFSHLVTLMPTAITNKIASFIDGVDSDFFSTDQLDLSAINCFNLENVYRLNSLSSLTYYTLLNQIITDFMYRTPKHLPKYLLVDEAHTPLKSKAFQEVVDNFSRTGNKNLIGLGFFTQSPQELGSLDFWPSLKAAVSTLIFTADPDMDKELYQKVFSLSDKEIEHISHLVPRKELYLIQREVGVSKRLSFIPSEYYMQNFTSNPVEIHQYQKVSL